MAHQSEEPSFWERFMMSDIPALEIDELLYPGPDPETIEFLQAINTHFSDSDRTNPIFRGMLPLPFQDCPLVPVRPEPEKKVGIQYTEEDLRSLRPFYNWIPEKIFNRGNGSQDVKRSVRTSYREVEKLSELRKSRGQRPVFLQKSKNTLTKEEKEEINDHWEIDLMNKVWHAMQKVL
jgi:hypothetical protein